MLHCVCLQKRRSVFDTCSTGWALNWFMLFSWLLIWHGHLVASIGSYLQHIHTTKWPDGSSEGFSAIASWQEVQQWSTSLNLFETSQADVCPASSNPLEVPWPDYADFCWKDNRFEASWVLQRWYLHGISMTACMLTCPVALLPVGKQHPAYMLWTECSPILTALQYLAWEAHGTSCSLYIGDGWATWRAGVVATRGQGEVQRMQSKPGVPDLPRLLFPATIQVAVDLEMNRQHHPLEIQGRRQWQARQGPLPETMPMQQQGWYWTWMTYMWHGCEKATRSSSPERIHHWPCRMFAHRAAPLRLPDHAGTTTMSMAGRTPTYSPEKMISFHRRQMRMRAVIGAGHRRARRQRVPMHACQGPPRYKQTDGCTNSESPCSMDALTVDVYGCLFSQWDNAAQILAAEKIVPIDRIPVLRSFWQMEWLICNAVTQPWLQVVQDEWGPRSGAVILSEVVHWTIPILQSGQVSSTTSKRWHYTQGAESSWVGTMQGPCTVRSIHAQLPQSSLEQGAQTMAAGLELEVSAW